MLVNDTVHIVANVPVDVLVGAGLTVRRAHGTYFIGNTKHSPLLDHTPPVYELSLIWVFFKNFGHIYL